MKFSELKQAMDWRRRVGFNGGGYVKKKILPKKKPEEEVKKRKLENFEKAKPALENPKEVKEMIDKPKRGLVDEPGSYSGELPENLSDLTEAFGNKIRLNVQGKNAGKIALTTGDGKTKYYNNNEAGIKKLRKIAEDKKITSKGYVDPKRALRRKNLYIQTYGQKSFDNLTSGEKSKVTSGDRNPLNVGQGRFKAFDPKFEPYRKEALKVFEKFKKSKKPFAPIDVAEKTIENMKGKKGAIKNINVPLFTQNLTRSFFTDEQREFFNIKDANIKRIIKKQAPKQIIFEEMIKGNSNIKSLMQATNLSKKEVERIVKNITTTDIPKARKELALGKDIQNVVLRNFTAKDFGTFRAALANEPTLNITFRKAIEELVTDAYRGQPKKLKRALTRLESYFSVAKKLREAGYPINLDHPLARSVIEDMGKVDPEQLIKVTPIPENINVGIKNNLFDRTYRQVINNLKARNLSTEDRKKLLIQKKSLESLQKDLNLGDMRMTSTGKIGKYGATGPLEKDFVRELKGVANFQNKFKSALESFEPQVLKEKIKGAFNVTDSKANQIIKTLTNAIQETDPQKYLKILKSVLKGKKGILEGLQADASGALDTLSQAIFPPLQAAEVLPGKAQAASPKPMEFDLDMSLPKPSEPLKYLPDYGDAALAGYAAAGASKYMNKGDPLKKFRRFITASPVRKGLGKLIQAAGTPLAGPLFAATNVYSKMKEGQSLADAIVDPVTGLELAAPALFKQSVSKIIPEKFQGRAAKIGRGALRLRGLPIGPIGLTLAGLGQAQEFYNQYQALQSLKEQNPRAYSAFMESRQMPALSAAEQTAIEDMGRFGAAGGGIMKMAGKSSGPPPESGPTPQGLDFLMKRGR